MNPADPNLPHTNKDAPTSQVNGIDQAAPSLGGNDIFIVTPTVQKPLDKKSTSFVIVATIVGIILLVVVILFALIGSATSVANQYRSLALVQIDKINTPLDQLEPSAVLNQRNIDKPLQTITFSQQSQPELQSVLLVGSWSNVYTQTETLQVDVQHQYNDIEAYSQDIKSLLAFDDMMNGIFTQEPNLAATINPSDSLTIRSVSGSYQNFATQIKNQAAPKELSSAKTQLVAVYTQKAAIYLAWAKQIEAGNSGYQATAQTAIATQAATATKLTADQNYVNQLKPVFTKLTNQQKLLKSELGG